MTEAKKKETGGLSRREFLKDAGLLIGGTAIGSTMVLAACGGEETTKTVESTKTVTTTETVEVPMSYPLSEGYLVVDSNKCMGCTTCMLACSMVHEGEENLSLARIQIIQNPYARYPDDIDVYQCRQCVDPLCVQACPTGACHVDTANGNVRVIDESLCIGCKQCLEACPFIPHRTVWNAGKSKATKCDLCLDTPFWSETGGPDGKQACVEVCPNKALKLVKDVPSQLGTVEYDINLREQLWPLDQTL